MKNKLLLLSIFLFISSCEEKKNIPTKEFVKKENEITDKKIYGDIKLNEKYNLLFAKIETINDSLKGHNFFNNTFKKVSCKCNTLKDYYNDVDGFMIRETEILIDNKIKLKVLYKSGPNYIYTYNDKPFKIKNYFGIMYDSDSEIYFSLEQKNCFLISENKYLLSEQPSSWCGLANQFDFYQIVDMDKMEIIQFVEKDDKLK